MSSVQQVNPTVRGIRAPTSLQSLAARITEEITQGVNKPFQQVIDVSSGDPHRAGMAPTSFVRQVMAVCLYPELLKDNSFPLDVRQKAHMLLGACCGGSVGSYSVTTLGIPCVQKSIAEFITRRDGGVISNPEDIIISRGSQKCLSMILHLMASGEGDTRTGVLIPMPCPHTLPPLLDMSGVTLVPYQLMEDQGWAVDLHELQRALRKVKGRCEPRAIYISNPGNPTGHLQNRKTIEEVIRFAATEGLILLAEEVYQDCVYGQGQEFISYKRVLFEMGKEYSETVELVSFHCLSSACMGECGLRGGYMEVINMDPAVNMYLKKVPVSPPVLSQLALEVMVNPPTAEDPSYKTYSQEILHSQTTLSQNAQRAFKFLNDLPGMNCQPAMGGVFLYPCLHLPPQMIEEAEMLGVEADALYCQRLLEEEGVCFGAGCENGQEGQNYHIRLCVLAPPATLEEVLARLRSFHLHLLDRFP
ncbi:alanine aminotransferase 2-like [Epinephelus moara]|uniref:alanine aminotransferase 2-like n=1 Tax=Epinephelus moara TaxID=300413 RepID=UPI00214E17FB|nr:alanine aminotransferase 2-like [Epinephelus moara]XP_049911243.1 alanine aminotransferase 2-like [Epinephelus moara]